MVRRALGGYGVKPRKAPKEVTPRNLAAEQRLGEAINRRVLVELRYDDDMAFRLIAPYVVFQTEAGSVCLSCFQINNPGEPMDANEPRNFTVGKVSAVRLTDTRFAIDPRFNRHDPKYRHGVLYSV